MLALHRICLFKNRDNQKTSNTTGVVEDIQDTFSLIDLVNKILGESFQNLYF